MFLNVRVNEHAKSRSSISHDLAEYNQFMYRDHTVENAEKSEYGSALDARELHLDLHARPFEDYVGELYGSEMQRVRTLCFVDVDLGLCIIT